MRMVCENLDSFNGFSIPVAGKTGTAQQVKNRPNHALFVGYAPYDNPEVAIAVVIENGGSGAAVSNVARDILDYYFSDEYNSGTGYSENELNK